MKACPTRSFLPGTSECSMTDTGTTPTARPSELSSLPGEASLYSASLRTRKWSYSFPKYAAPVRKGDIKRVVDVGAGTGLLSMYAADSTPAVTEVVAFEANTKMAKMAEMILDMNHDVVAVKDVAMDDDGDNVNNKSRVTVLPNLSTDYQGNFGDFDLLITETFDAGLFGEHVLESLYHAHKVLINKTSRD